MPIFYVAEFHEGLIKDPQVVVAPATSGWRFFARCEQDSIESCTLLYTDFVSLGRNEKKAFTDLWEYIWEAGKAGKSWNQIFQDGKLFHPVHEFNVKRVDSKSGKTRLQSCNVYQFKKKKTAIRVLFVYTDKSLIAFVTHAFEKDGQETPAREKTRAESTAQDFYAALDAKTIQLITVQGGKNATQGIFAI